VQYVCERTSGELVVSVLIIYTSITYWHDREVQFFERSTIVVYGRRWKSKLTLCIWNTLGMTP
jgi:hypothetical protein